MVLPVAAGAFQDPSGPNLLSIAELQNKVDERGRAIESFQIEGVVCAVIREKNAVVLQDDSATALFELQSVDEKIRVGEWLEIQGDQCTLTKTRFGIQAGTAPVVNNDGTHATLIKSGSVFLGAGRRPIRLLWFNHEAPCVLNLEYEGAGIPRQKIPSSLLWHQPANAANHTNFQRPGERILKTLPSVVSVIQSRFAVVLRILSDSAG